jgi:hypothetical protein
MPWGFALENGDVNGDQVRDVSDGVYLLANLFTGGPAPVPLAYCADLSPAVANGDANADGDVDVSDPIRILIWLYAGGGEPAAACVEGEGGGAEKGENEGRGKGVPRIAPPNSNAFGKSLAEWMETYWRWNYSGGSNMVGRVALLPIPAPVQIGGSGTAADPAYFQGEIELEVEPGTPFVLPQFAWIAETYDPTLGIPDDPCIADDVLLAGVTPLTITIDGRVIVSDANEAAFYTPCTPFDPPVVYGAPSSYGSIGAIAYQGVGFVSAPLTPGRHEIHLYEEYIIDGYMGFSFGTIYDNTWKILVKP